MHFAVSLEAAWVAQALYNDRHPSLPKHVTLYNVSPGHGLDFLEQGELRPLEDQVIERWDRAPLIELVPKHLPFESSCR